MNLKSKNYYIFNFIILVLLSAIANCPSIKAESIDKTATPNDVIHELIQQTNPDIIDFEIDKIIQIDILRKTAPYFSEEWIKALRSYYRELIAYQEIEDYQSQGNIHKKIAYAYSALGLMYKEIEHYQYAIKAYSQTTDKFASMHLLDKLGKRYLEIGELEKAERYLKIAYWRYQESLDNQKRTIWSRYIPKSKSDINRNINNIGYLYILKGENEQAIAVYQQAFKYSLIVGEIYLKQGQSKKAITYFKDLLNVYEKSCSRFCSSYYPPYYRKQIYNYLGQAYFSRNDLDSSLFYYKLALDENNYDNLYSAKSYFGLGQIFAQSNNDNQAIVYLLKALKIYQENKYVKNIFIIRKIYKNIGDIYTKTNNPNRAIIYYEKSLNLAFEAKHLLLESFPQQFYQENNATLNKLLLLLKANQQKDKYHLWKKRQNNFDINQYWKAKYINDILVESQDKKIISEWVKKTQQLKYAYKNTHSNMYNPKCELEVASYQKVKQELNELAIEINIRAPHLAQLLQISNQHLIINSENQVCSKKRKIFQ